MTADHPAPAERAAPELAVAEASTPEIRAALFDVEGVIARADVAEADRRLGTLRPGLTLRQLQVVRNLPANYPLWEAYSIGAMTSEAYWSAILASLGLPAPAEQVEAVIGIQRATAWARLDPAVLDLARALGARGLRLGILSNSAPYHDEAIAGFAGAFDVAHFSHRTGRRKPMAEAYLEAARALGVPAEAIVFIDDKARNTVAAEQVGMRAVQFQAAEALAGALAALGLVAPD